MRTKNHPFINQFSLNDFQLLLKEYDIKLDIHTQKQILSIIQNNQYALIHDQYQFIIENYIKKLTSEFTCQQVIHLLNSYFKPLLKV